MGQTVNLLAKPSEVRILLSPPYFINTELAPPILLNAGIAHSERIPIAIGIQALVINSISGSSSFGRAKAFQALGGEFEPRLPLKKKLPIIKLEAFFQKLKIPNPHI